MPKPFTGKVIIVIIAYRTKLLTTVCTCSLLCFFVSFRLTPFLLRVRAVTVTVSQRQTRDREELPYP